MYAELEILSSCLRAGWWVNLSSPAAPLLGRDNYHVLDVHLFYTSVHANAVDRVEAYLAATARP